MMNPQRRIVFYVDEELYDRFFEAVFKRFRKTSGGVLSEAGAEALKLWIEKEEEGK